MSSRRKLILPLAFVVLALTAWHGFYRQRQLIETGRSAPPLKATLKRIFSRPGAELARLDELRRRGGRLGMPPDDEEECWRIVRGLSLAQVKDYLAEIPFSENQQTDEAIRKMLYNRWAQLDPQDAADQLAGKDGSGPEWAAAYGGLRTVVAVWVKQDPDAAIKWIEGRQGDHMLRRSANFILGSLWVRQDPATAVEKCRAQAPFALPGVSDALCRNAGSSEVIRQQLFGLLADPAVRPYSDQTLSSAGRNWAWADPEGALRSTEHYGMDDSSYDKFRSSVVATVAQRQPRRALDLLGGPAAAPGQDSDLSRVFRQVVEKEPEVAADWAGQNHRGDLLVEAIEGLARYAAAPSPDGPDLTKRTQALAVTYQVWNRLDPEAAGKWSAGLPGSLRTKLTSSPSPSPSSDDGSR